MSDLTRTERVTVDGVTELLTRYVTAYVHGDRDGFSACFAREVSMAVGDEFLSSRELRERRGGERHYFERRRGHWRPPIGTTLSVRPINAVAALGRVRWVYPPTSTGLQYQNVSLYLCALTGDGWRIVVVTTPTDSGETLVAGNETHLEWDLPGWEIFQDG